MNSDKIRWLACIACAGVPMVIFLIVNAIFPAGDRELETVATSLRSTPDALLTFSSAKLGVLTFTFGIFAFGHVMLSGLVSLYFLAVAKKNSADPARILPQELALLLALAAAASLLLIAATFNWTGLFAGFGGMVIDPFLLFYKTLGFSSEFKNFEGGAETFLSLAVLVPTMFGIICVVFASGAFHLVILQRVRPGNEGWEESFQKCTAMLKLHLTILSLLLVSSTLTARYYFHMVPELLSKEAAEAKLIYGELASAISSGAGLLFTLTLIATFAPGIVILLSDLFGLKFEGEENSLPALLEKINLSDWSTKLSAVLRGMITIAAPVLAGPFMDAVSAILK